MHVKNLADMLHAQLLLLVQGKILSRANHILDLSPVELFLGKKSVLLFGKILNFHLSVRYDPVDKHFENRLLCLGVKCLVAQGNVNSGSERIVKSLEAKVSSSFS